MRVGSNLLTTLSRIQETCQQGQDPLSFEELNHPYGYVVYSTTLSGGGTKLQTPNVNDYGYVFVNNVYQVRLSEIYTIFSNYRAW